MGSIHDPTPAHWLTDSNKVQGLKKYVTTIDCAEYDCRSNLWVSFTTGFKIPTHIMMGHVSELGQNYVEECQHHTAIYWQLFLSYLHFVAHILTNPCTES